MFSFRHVHARTYTHVRTRARTFARGTNWGKHSYKITEREMWSIHSHVCIRSHKHLICYQFQWLATLTHTHTHTRSHIHENDPAPFTYWSKWWFNLQRAVLAFIPQHKVQESMMLTGVHFQTTKWTKMIQNELKSLSHKSTVRASKCFRICTHVHTWM